MEFHINVNNALKGLQNVNDKFRRGTALYGESAAIKMEAYAKARAPWRDRTGNARDTLKGIYGWGSISANIQTEQAGRASEYGNTSTAGGMRYHKIYPVQGGSSSPTGDYGNTFVIGISGNMNYSPYLEYAHGQKYAILRQTVNVLAPEVIRGWAAMLSRIK